jgi:ferredoxin
MVRILIDDRPVEVPPGTTVLAAARALDIDLPALCYREGHPHNTACMCCLVRVEGRGGPIASCATTVVEGMRVACETPELHELRRTGIELLLSDHEGDCHAPCQTTCPAHMDIPDMLRQAAAGHYRDALATVKRDIALPATLGRVCPEVCEKACRRAQVDQPAAICQIKRYLADRDLFEPESYLPPRAEDTGRRVAVVGAGPTGLAAAYHLRLAGHDVTLWEQADAPGGRLRTEFSPDQLPPEVLDAEIRVIERLGVTLRMGVQVGVDPSLAQLCAGNDAVLLATGKHDVDVWAAQGVAVAQGRVVVDPQTQQTNLPQVFAAGGAVRPNPLIIKSVAAGKEAGRAVSALLAGRARPAPARGFEVRRQRLDEHEVAALRELAPGVRLLPAALDADDDAQAAEAARREAERCLHCDCGSLAHCLLRRYAEAYDCDPHRFKGAKRQWQPCLEHHGVRLEPGKCIQCGICVQIAAELGEPIGLAFVGRGFEVRVGVPLDRSLDEALLRAGPACADACPTGAIARLPLYQLEGGSRVVGATPLL